MMILHKRNLDGKEPRVPMVGKRQIHHADKVYVGVLVR